MWGRPPGLPKLGPTDPIASFSAELRQAGRPAPHSRHNPTTHPEESQLRDDGILLLVLLLRFVLLRFVLLLRLFLLRFGHLDHHRRRSEGEILAAHLRRCPEYEG